MKWSIFCTSSPSVNPKAHVDKISAISSHQKSAYLGHHHSWSNDINYPVSAKDLLHLNNQKLPDVDYAVKFHPLAVQSRQNELTQKPV